jgi:hypothetical protein
MTKLTKASVSMNGFVPSLIELIKEWEPDSFTRELKYRDSLLQYIAENVPSDCRVEKEYRHNGTTTDLFLKWSGFMFNDEVFIEVKMNMNKKPTLDRLVGQLESLEPGKRNIVVVLVGETDAALLKRLKEKYERYSSGSVPDPLNDTLDIVVK